MVTDQQVSGAVGNPVVTGKRQGSLVVFEDSGPERGLNVQREMQLGHNFSDETFQGQKSLQGCGKRSVLSFHRETEPWRELFQTSGQFESMMM